MRDIRKSISRRRFVGEIAAGAGVTALLPLLATHGSYAATSGKTTLTICSYGGIYQESQDKAYFTPYQKAHPNIAIIQDSPESDAKLKVMVESHNVTWDIAVTSDSFGLDADAKWLEPIDYSIIDRSQFGDGYAGNYRICADVESTLMAYRTDKFKTTPKGFADFFDTATFPGKRTAWKYASGGIFEIALIADGVDPKQLYPIDVNRALKKLGTIKDKLIWWDTGAQSVQYLTSGEATLGILWNGRAVSAGESAPVSLAWEQWLYNQAWWVVPKGTPHKAAVMEALKYFTSAAAQAEYTKYLPYGPSNKLAFDKVSPKYQKDLPTSHMTTGIPVNYVWWNENLAKVDPVFQEWLLK